MFYTSSPFHPEEGPGWGGRGGFRGRFRGPGRGGFRGAFGPFGAAQRGSVKYDVLAILEEGPRHGYDIMTAIEAKRGYRPSPGSIYPALQMLDDGDFVTSRETDGKRIYAITDKGRDMLREYQASPQGARFEDAPAEAFAAVARGMRTLHGLRDAAKQIVRSGDVTLIGRGVEILERARRELYALLAEAS
jgi:DNA-binding PadR family transcriptional regulator